MIINIKYIKHFNNLYDSTTFFFLDTSSPIIAPKIEREEPEKIKKWREEQKTRLEEKGIVI
jgi:hypothetical protein